MYESPDSFEKNGKYYDYIYPGNYTGVMNSDGNFVMSKQIVGHGSLLPMIRREELDDVESMIIHNFDSIDKIYNDFEIKDGDIKFRIWPEPKVFSMWERYKPSYKPAIESAIKAMGGDPTHFKYDMSDVDGSKYNYDNFSSYDEIMKDDISDEEKEQLEIAQRKKMENERAYADYLNRTTKIKPSIDLDIMPKKRGFYSREGD